MFGRLLFNTYSKLINHFKSSLLIQCLIKDYKLTRWKALPHNWEDEEGGVPFIGIRRFCKCMGKSSSLEEKFVLIIAKDAFPQRFQLTKLLSPLKKCSFIAYRSFPEMGLLKNNFLFESKEQQREFPSVLAQKMAALSPNFLASQSLSKVYKSYKFTFLVEIYRKLA